MTTLVTINANYIKRVLVLCLAMTLTACAGSNGNLAASKDPMVASVAKQTIDEPKQYSRAMQIFFYQSRVGNAVMDQYPFLDTGDGHPTLVEAEARMMTACSHLAQAALHKVSGGEPGVRLKFMVFLTLDACEGAAREVDMLLRSDTVLADGSL